jgi:hypothetical protein
MAILYGITTDLPRRYDLWSTDDLEEAIAYLAHAVTARVREVEGLGWLVWGGCGAPCEHEEHIAERLRRAFHRDGRAQIVISISSGREQWEEYATLLAWEDEDAQA